MPAATQSHVARVARVMWLMCHVPAFNWTNPAVPGSHSSANPGFGLASPGRLLRDSPWIKSAAKKVLQKTANKMCKNLPPTQQFIIHRPEVPSIAGLHRIAKSLPIQPKLKKNVVSDIFDFGSRAKSKMLVRCPVSHGTDIPLNA